MERNLKTSGIMRHISLTLSTNWITRSMTIFFLPKAGCLNCKWRWQDAAPLTGTVITYFRNQTYINVKTLFTCKRNPLQVWIYLFTSSMVNPMTNDADESIRKILYSKGYWRWKSLTTADWNGKQKVHHWTDKCVLRQVP